MYVVYISGSFTTSHSPEEGHPSPKVLGKYCFSQKLLTGQLSTAHGYPSASPTKRDNTPFKKTARSEAVVAEVPASRSGRERRPQLRPVEEAWQDAVFNYLHGGERVELSMEYTTASRKKGSPSFFNAVV